MPAILLGSISTLVDTSELQRAAFNRAFEQHGLDWRWDQPHYRDLLTSNGGAGRIAAYASERGEDVDADAVHATKSKLFQEHLATTALVARAGVVDTIRAAHDADWSVALVTTTSRANLAALLAGLDGISEDDFALVTDVDTVADPKPDPAVYAEALARLGESAGDCVAVEDNVGGVRSATDAGISCVAFPNENTTGHDVGDTPVVTSLSFDDLASRVAAR